MRLLSIHKNSTKSDKIARYMLLQKTYKPSLAYERYLWILGQDKWYGLVNNDEQIVAECLLNKVNYPFTWITRYYEITDVVVPKQFRGNGYSTILLLNIICDNGDKYPYRITAEQNNLPAYRSYRKVFGEPYKMDEQFIYFST